MAADKDALLCECLPYLTEQHTHYVVLHNGTESPVSCDRCDLAARIITAALGVSPNDAISSTP